VVDGEIEDEQQTTMRAVEAAAILKTIGEDQRIPGVSAALYLLRVSQPMFSPFSDRFSDR